MQLRGNLARLVTGIAIFLLPALYNVHAASSKIPTLTSAQAAAHVGSRAKVCGTVVDARHAIQSKGQPTYLNFDKPYPHPAFTALIWGKDRDNFGMPPDIQFRGHIICITGKIETSHGTPQIVVRSPDQISGR